MRLRISAAEDSVDWLLKGCSAWDTTLETKCDSAEEDEDDEPVKMRDSKPRPEDSGWCPLECEDEDKMCERIWPAADPEDSEEGCEDEEEDEDDVEECESKFCRICEAWAELSLWVSPLTKREISCCELDDEDPECEDDDAEIRCDRSMPAP